VLWAALPLVTQMAVAIVTLIVVCVGFVAATRRLYDLQRFLDEFGDEFEVAMIPLGTFTTLIVALVVTWGLFRGQMGRCLAWRNVPLHQWLGIVLFMAPLAVVASEISNCALDLATPFEPQWLRDFRESTGEVMERFVRQSWLLVFLGGCLLPGISEEIYCRGFLSRGLVARHGVVWGTLLTSLLFGAMHLEPVHCITTFAVGIGLQHVFLTTRSLLAPIVLHTLNNAVAFAAMRYQDVFPVPGVTVLPDGSVVHTPPRLMLTSTVALGAVAALLFQTRTRWVLPDGSEWSPGYMTAERPPEILAARPVSAGPHWGMLVITIGAYAAMIWALLAANRSVAA
jgi:membrane protease YdiL (CAAX protease family)